MTPTDTARAIVERIANSLEDYTTPQEIDAWTALVVPVIEEALTWRLGSVTTAEDEQKYDEWIGTLRRSNPTYWTERRAQVLLYAYYCNMTTDVEDALSQEWETARRDVYASGNAGWTHVVRSAVLALRDRARAAEKERDRAREDAVDYRTRWAETADMMRCPDCGCASPDEADGNECGCNGPVCMRQTDSLANAYVELQRESERLSRRVEELEAQLRKMIGLAAGMHAETRCHEPEKCPSQADLAEARRVLSVSSQPAPQPSEPHMPLTPCCVCGDLVCTYEWGECPDKREDHKNGAELSDGRWTCSDQCWEKAVAVAEGE